MLGLDLSRCVGCCGIVWAFTYLRGVMTSFACTIVVRGRVQGVCFRATTLFEARRLGLTGWVRNEPGGTVRIEAEGEREALESFVDWCRHGPEYAVVAHLAVDWHAPISNFEDFSVR